MLIRNLLLIKKNNGLIIQLVRREVASRYKGSFLGIIWSFITPLLMLLVYTFVFSLVFKSRWPGQSESQIEFALLIFSGMTMYNIFSEVVGKSSNLIPNNSNYVKKVVFPLAILPVVTLISTLIHAAISILILLCGLILFYNGIHLTVLLLPIVMLPMLLLTLGISWFVASIGVFFRDIGHLVNILLQVLMFLSPIFYPIESIPQSLRFLYYINPLSYTVEDARKVLVWGQTPNWVWIGTGSLIGLMIFILGYGWFQKTREGFSDVL
ncbi:ABC transporter permease [Cohnella nanjingensis]|uniref:Transport permease protein n=1 Tax=Cohnella nanjingensis TaxID=1387779 RepID=A0A7X0RQX7_9BACL|nr:ABC transporter permease [Cohnella nanjingensis]MBB6670624.1 ABC transporter permease [Cohnella nanjingensis]